jgi:hypothetical protein
MRDAGCGAGMVGVGRARAMGESGSTWVGNERWNALWASGVQ